MRNSKSLKSFLATLSFLTAFTFLTLTDFYGQLSYSTNFNTSNANPGEAQWDNTGFDYTATNACSGGSVKDNCWGTGTSAVVEMYNDATVGSIGTSSGGDLTISFDYKLLLYNSTNATPAADLKEIRVYTSSNGSTWILQQTYSTHVASTSCVTKSFTCSHPAGATYLKIEVEHSGVSSPDFDVYIDNLSIIEATCVDPSATYTVVDDCGNGQFNIDVNVSGLGDASGVDITDGVTTFQTNVGTGTYTVGPFTAGENKVIQVNGSSYSGCDISSGTLTEACACSNAPTASVSTSNKDCGASTYDIDVTITSDGDGDANMTDIKIDGVVVQADATTGNPYSFSVSMGAHTVTLDAEGASFVVCTSSDYNMSESCNNDECVDAFAVSVGGSVVTSLNTSVYTDSGNDLSCDGGTSEEDSYYSFIAPSSGWVYIDVDNSGLSGTDIIYVEGGLYASCADAASNTEVQCFNWGSALNNGQSVSGLTPGQTYYLEVEHYNNNWSGTYTVSIEDMAPELTMGTQTCGDFSVNWGSYADEVCTSGPTWVGSGDDELVYTFTPTSTGTIDIYVTDLANASETIEEMGFMFTDGTTAGSNCLASDFHAATLTSDLSATGVAVTAGTTYYLIVVLDGFDSTPEETFCVEIRTPCNSTGTTSVPVVDCTGGSYTGRINFSALTGATTYDLTDDNGGSYSNISTSTDYDFSYADLLAHTITLKGYDGGANLVCIETFEVKSGCNGSDDWRFTAPLLVSGYCYPGDLSLATADGPMNNGINLDNTYTGSTPPYYVVSGFSTNSLRTCDGGFDNGTDWVDLWYRVDLPDGTDEMSISINGLESGEYVCFMLNTGDPGLSNVNNQATFSTTTSFFSDAITTQVITGLADESTSDLYIRILNTSPDYLCASMTDPDFMICVNYAQPNDIKTNAIEIDGTSVAGDLCSANIDAEAVESGDVCSASHGENDLWYSVTSGASDPNTFATISVTFTNATDAVVISEFIYPSDTYNSCVTLTSTGAGSTVSHTFPDEFGANNDNYYRVTPLNGNSVCDFTISAERVVENNDCSFFNSSALYYNLHNDSEVADFTFASASNKDGISGKDVWFQYNHSSNQSMTLTTSDLGDWTGTAAIYLYEYPGTSVDCDNLTLYCSSTGLSDFDLESGVTFNLGTDDYLVRIVETTVDAEGDEMQFTLTGVTDATVILANSSCSSALDISSASKTGNFTEAQLACPQATITCGATSYNSTPFDDYYGAALWYKFTMPGTPCSGGAPLVSTEIRSVEISLSGLATNSGIGTKQAYVELYSDCNTLLECGQTVDNSTNAFFENLTIGDTYYIRVINNTLSSTSTSDFTVEAIIPGDPAPCNDYTSDSYTLPVLTDLDVDNLPIYSADGATVSNISYDDVWFDFIAPAQNGDNYPLATANLSFVTIYAENVSGDLMQFYVWDTVTAGEDNVTISNRISPSPANQDQTLSGVGDYTFFQVGHLVPGEKYYIQVFYNSPAKNGLTQKAGNNERFKLAVLQPGEDNSSLCNSGSTLKPIGVTGCRGDCQAIYKIEVEVTGNYQIEATGDSVSVVLNVYQNDTEMGGEQQEGYPYDQDHPCQVDQRLQDITARLISSTSIPSDEHGCYPNFTGERNVYNLTRSESSNRIYYYVEVIDQSAGGALHGCRRPEICELQMYAVGSSTTLYTGQCKTFGSGLPVEWMMFEAYNMGDDNQLVWMTASEINNSHFEVEHSLDGVHFEVLGRVEGNENSNEVIEYNFLHENIADGKHFYRLMQVDFNGERSYSEVRVVEKSSESNIHFYPNPVNSSNGLTIVSKDQIDDYKIIDASGKVVVRVQNANEKKVQVDISELSKGVYFLHVLQNEQISIERFIVE